MNKFNSLTQLISAYQHTVNAGDAQKDLSFEDVRTIKCETRKASSLNFQRVYGISVKTPTITMIANFGYVEN